MKRRAAKSERRKLEFQLFLATRETYLRRTWHRFRGRHAGLMMEFFNRPGRRWTPRGDDVGDVGDVSRQTRRDVRWAYGIHHSILEQEISHVHGFHGIRDGYSSDRFLAGYRAMSSISMWTSPGSLPDRRSPDVNSSWRHILLAAPAAQPPRHIAHSPPVLLDITLPKACGASIRAQLPSPRLFISAKTSLPSHNAERTIRAWPVRFAPPLTGYQHPHRTAPQRAWRVSHARAKRNISSGGCGC
ncbi:unnamed protein product [Diplocarpon coronariae]|nr:hypothetical protein JHW43_007884 [Diplocarpon mali]